MDLGLHVLVPSQVTVTRPVSIESMCSSSPPILVRISSLNRPCQNGKVERFNRTLQTEWASGKSSGPTAPAQQFCQTSSAARDDPLCMDAVGKCVEVSSPI